MKRMIAAFAIIGLAIAIAVYIAMAPLASPTATGGANALLASFDSLVDTIEASVGRSTGALIAIGTGLALALILALFPSKKPVPTLGDEFLPAESEPAPPALRTQNDNAPSQRLAHVRERAAHNWAEATPEPEPETQAPQEEPEVEPAAPQAPAQTFEPQAPAFQPEPTPQVEVQPQTPQQDPFQAREVYIERKVRDPQRDWFADASWLGGLPRLGPVAWPHDANGTPLPFLAQIDRNELSAALPDAVLPEFGSLAFFLGDGGVVPVPAGPFDFSEPPQNLPPAFEEGGAILPRTATHLTRWLFPFWPVTPRNPASTDTVPPAARDHPFYAVGVGEPVETVWWHSVFHFVERLKAALETAEGPISTQRERLRDLRQALARIEADADADPYERDDMRDDVEGAEAELAQIEEQRQALPQMLQALETFLEGRTPWAVLSEDELEVMRDLLPETHERYGELIGKAIPGSLAELATISLRAAISGPPEALAAIPESVLTRLNEEYRLPPESEHRLFAPIAGTDEVALLDLAWDDLVEWTWPEEGRCQLRLGRAELASGAWHMARAVFVTN